MSILVDENSRVVVQGITGGEGSFHSRQMIEYGTNVVAGVTPGKGGQKFDDKVPVFNTLNEAVAETGANASAIFVPPPNGIGTDDHPFYDRVIEAWKQLGEKMGDVLADLS